MSIEESKEFQLLLLLKVVNNKLFVSQGVWVIPSHFVNIKMDQIAFIQVSINKIVKVYIEEI
jgi:hypothetical protein